GKQRTGGQVPGHHSAALQEGAGMSDAHDTSAQPVLSVLIVDDEAPARSRMRELLGDIAAEQPTRLVGMAANGVEALRLLEHESADVVLADIQMPAMDGVELARHLSRMDSPPVMIFTTAHDEYA